jgi:hypothetical protein
MYKIFVMVHHFFGSKNEKSLKKLKNLFPGSSWMPGKCAGGSQWQAETGLCRSLSAFPGSFQDTV